jgi:hypothetical protein
MRTYRLFVFAGVDTSGGAPGPISVPGVVAGDLLVSITYSQPSGILTSLGDASGNFYPVAPANDTIMQLPSIGDLTSNVITALVEREI